MAAIAAVTGSVWRTVIENRMRWRWQAWMTLADQRPESARMVSSRPRQRGGPAPPTR
jgi:hypothetical protein